MVRRTTAMLVTLAACRSPQAPVASTEDATAPAAQVDASITPDAPVAEAAAIDATRRFDRFASTADPFSSCKTDSDCTIANHTDCCDGCPRAGPISVKQLAKLAERCATARCREPHDCPSADPPDVSRAFCNGDKRCAMHFYER